MKPDFKFLLLAALGASFAVAAGAQQAAGNATPTPLSPPMTEGAALQPRQPQARAHAMPDADSTTRMERRVQRRQVHIAQHLAGLKVKLNLTPEQQGAWETFSSTVTPTRDQLMHRVQLRQSMRSMSTPERIDRMRELRAERTAAMDRYFDATKQFYAQLSPEQQKSFDQNALPRLGRGGWHGHEMRGRHHRGEYRDHEGGPQHADGERMR